MEIFKNVAPYVTLMIAGIIAFMKVKSDTDINNKSIDKIEKKLDEQDKDIVKLTIKIDAVLIEQKQTNELLKQLPDLINKSVNNEINRRELEDLRK